MSKIVKWETSIENFPNAITIDGLYDDYEGFRILVRGGKPSNVYRISFGDYYLGYRNFDESERLKSLSQFPVNCREWSLFKADDSDFIDWVHSESNHIQLKEDITHFYIVTQNDIVEILCLKEPIIEEL